MKRGRGLRSDPAKTRAWQNRSRKPLPAVGRKGQREEAALAAFRADVRERSGGECEVATPACPSGRHRGAQAHHVFPSDRDRGRHEPDRGLFVCFSGHNWIHDHPTEAEEAGWLGRS